MVYVDKGPSKKFDKLPRIAESAPPDICSPVLTSDMLCSLKLIFIFSLILFDQ